MRHFKNRGGAGRSPLREECVCSGKELLQLISESPERLCRNELMRGNVEWLTKFSHCASSWRHLWRPRVKLHSASPAYNLWDGWASSFPSSVTTRDSVCYDPLEAAHLALCLQPVKFRRPAPTDLQLLFSWSFRIKKKHPKIRWKQHLVSVFFVTSET